MSTSIAFVVCLVITVQVSKAQSPEITPAPEPLVRRDALPTLVISTPAAWIDTAASIPTNLGSNKVIVTADANSIPQVLLGRNVANNVKTAVQESCASGTSSDCISKIATGPLNQDNGLVLQARIAPGLLAFAALAVLISYVLALEDKAANNIQIVKFAPDIYSSALTAQSSGTMVLATASGGPYVTCALSAVEPTMTSSVIFSTATADASGLSKNAVVMILPTADASEVTEIAKPSACPKKRSLRHLGKRGLSVDWGATAQLATEMLSEVEIGGELQIIRTAINLNVPALIQAAETARQTVIAAGQKLTELGLTPASLSVVAGVVLFIAVSVRYCLTLDTNKYVMPAEFISGTESGGESSPDRKSCSTKYESNCKNCGGSAASDVCAGIKTKSNKLGGCKCHSPVKYKYALEQGFVQQALKQWTDLKTMKAKSATLAPASTKPAPSSTAQAAKPSATCSCNENGCTSDSPACCANGTCEPGKIASPVCTKWEDLFQGCHKDLDENKLNTTAQHLVENQMGNQDDLVMTSQSINFTQVYNAGSSVTYLAVVSWIPGCTKQSQQNPKFPTGDKKSQDWTYNIVYWNWKKCVNHGLGGYTDVGCLRIGFYTTRLSGVFGGPPHPEKYFGDGNSQYC